jgi:hypothetical protein
MIYNLVKCEVAICFAAWSACAAAQASPRLSEVFRVELHIITYPDVNPVTSSLPRLPSVSGGFSDDSHYVVWGVADVLHTVTMASRSAEKRAIDDLSWAVPSPSCRMWVVHGQAGKLIDIPTGKTIDTIAAPKGLLRVRGYADGLVACTETSIEVLRRATSTGEGSNVGPGPRMAWEWTSTRVPNVIDVESAFGTIVAYTKRTPSSGRLYSLDGDRLRELADVAAHATNVERGLSCDDKRVIVTGFGFRVFHPGAHGGTWTKSNEARIVKRVHLIDDQHAIVAMDDGLEVVGLAGVWMTRGEWKCPGRVLDLAWCSLSKKCCAVFQHDGRVHAVVFHVR